MGIVKSIKAGVTAFKQSQSFALNPSVFYTTDSGFSSLLGQDLSRQKMLGFFLDVPQLYMTISLKASMFSKMILTVENKITNDPVENELSKLIAKPNFHQGQKEFLVQTKVFREIFGNEYLYGLTPLGFDMPSQLNTLDPYNLSVETITDTMPLFLRSEMPDFNYLYNTNGTIYKLPSRDVLQINNPVLKTNGTIEQSVTGTSSISSLISPLENIVGAYESRGHLIHNRGALGILTNSGKDSIGAKTITQPEKEALQEEFRKYGLKKNQWSTIVTNLQLQWQKMGSSVKDLMLFEEQEDDFQAIIGAYGMKRELFPSLNGSTFENQKQAEKSTYINTIIPEAIEWVNALNNRFNTQDLPYEIRASYKHLPIFDEDLKDRGIALLQNVKALEIMLAQGGINTDDFVKECNKLLGNE